MALDPSSLSVDTSNSLNATHILYLKTDHAFKGKTKVLDFTKQPHPLYWAATGLSDKFLLEADSIAKSTPSPALYTLKRENVLASKATVKDADGSQVAEWSSPLLAFGKTTFTFSGGEHASHDVEMTPMACGTRTMKFVKDSVPYFWESTWFESEERRLFKVVSGMKKEVARYAQTKGRVKGGVLVLDEDEIDVLVCLMTLCACLEGKDSFSR